MDEGLSSREGEEAGNVFKMEEGSLGEATGMLFD